MDKISLGEFCYLGWKFPFIVSVNTEQKKACRDYPHGCDRRQMLIKVGGLDIESRLILLEHYQI